MFSDLAFPQNPPVFAEWQPIYLEPIINSGERITILILLKDNNGKITINRAIDERVLKSLYSRNYSQISGLINYIENTISRSSNWTPPFDGIYVGGWSKAVDFSIEGILRQALSLTSSLSTYINPTEDTLAKPFKDPNKWLNEVKNLVINANPNLMDNFEREITIGKNISYKYSFKYKSFVANLIDFKSINNQKSQTSILQMQLLSKNSKITDRSLILQVPTSLDLENMSKPKQEALKEKITIFSEILSDHEVNMVQVETAEEASQKLLSISAA